MLKIYCDYPVIGFAVAVSIRVAVFLVRLGRGE